MARHELARFQESDHEVVYQERKRYSDVDEAQLVERLSEINDDKYNV
jgi:hypothetical protein